jgi:NAD(P)-dependent dehydrogenase (short-subunit alcohol dehydrogenase family)
MFDFTDKVALVTGSSRGIGRVIARELAKAGAKVAVHYVRNRQAAEETLGLLGGEPHIIVQAEMGDAEEVREMVSVVVSHFGCLDILINNAGMNEAHPVAEVSYEEWCENWKRVIDTNLIGPANAAYCAARRMMEQGGGRIVNISSRGAFRGEPESPAYGASKGGMNSMTGSLAKYERKAHSTVLPSLKRWLMQLFSLPRRARSFPQERSSTSTAHPIFDSE